MALIHIIGSIITVLAIGVFVLWIGSWQIERYQNREREELAIRLGVALADLDNQDLIPKIIQISSERFSSDLLRNRVSDFAEIIRTVWEWTGSAIQVVVLCAVIWQSFSDGLDNAIYAWSLVGITIFFWITSVIFSLLCRLFTGRYPGQAKLARKSISNFLNQNKHRLG